MKRLKWIIIDFADKKKINVMKGIGYRMKDKKQNKMNDYEKFCIFLLFTWLLPIIIVIITSIILYLQ